MKTRARWSRFIVDCSPHVCVGVCTEPGCGARYLTGSRAGCLRALGEHTVAAHADLRNAAAQRLGQVDL